VVQSPAAQSPGAQGARGTRIDIEFPES